MVDIFCGKRVYLAGPMTGMSDYNRAEFNRAEALLREMGAAFVWNPCALVEPYEAGLLTEEQCRAKDIRALVGKEVCVDAVVLLNGWSMSCGANFEQLVARWLGIPIYALDIVEQCQNAAKMPADGA